MKNKIIILIIIASPIMQIFGQCNNNSQANAPNSVGINCPKPQRSTDNPPSDPVPQDPQPQKGPQEGCPGGDPFLEIEKYTVWAGQTLTLEMPEGHYNKLSINGMVVNNTTPFMFSRDEPGTHFVDYELDNGQNCKTQGKICIIVVEGIYVTKKIICDETRENYQVMLSVSGEGLGQGYIVTDNETGVVFGPATNLVITLPTRQVPMGYSYTITSVENPDCKIIVEESMVDCTTTAIELVLFDGSVETEGNELRWQTASEINVENFIIEKSSNGIDFEKLEKVKASGNSNSNNSYTAMDLETRSGIYYYRLLEVDHQGISKKASDVILLERKSDDLRTISIVPNPASETIFIEFNNDINAIFQLRIINSMGQVMVDRALTDGENENGRVQLNVWDFSAGIYYVGLVLDGVERCSVFVKE